MAKKDTLVITILIILGIFFTFVSLIIVLILSTGQSAKAEKPKTENVLRKEDIRLNFPQQATNKDSSCPHTSGIDTDNDGIIDLCDNCPNHYNPDQNDRDLNGKGDICDSGEAKGGAGGKKITCSKTTDCGNDGLIGKLFCSQNNVTRLFVSYTCNNPGTKKSSCSSSEQQKTIEECKVMCLDGKCIICVQDSDCPGRGIIGEPFCIVDNIFQKFERGLCKNPKTVNATCEALLEDRQKESCKYACAEGKCIRCNENSDCDDNNETTEDICRLPGKINSYCENIKKIFKCGDGIDNDNDGFIDYPADLGCDSILDDSEEPFNFHQCNDKIDNDNDGFVDFPDDKGCENPFDNSEEPFNYPECSDGIDNDHDGFIDYPADKECTNRIDNDESK